MDIPTRTIYVTNVEDRKLSVLMKTISERWHAVDQYVVFVDQNDNIYQFDVDEERPPVSCPAKE